MPKEYIEYQNKITSADDLNKQGRKSDVLVAALEKCEKLEKQLKIAVEALERYSITYDWEDCVIHREEEGLIIWERSCFIPHGYRIADKALKEIKELEDENSN